MNKVLLTATAVCLLGASAYAQNLTRACGTDEAKDYFIKTLPGYKQQVEAAEKQNAIAFQAYLSQMPAQRGANSALTTYTIPVVFHVLHTNGPENVSDAACIAALDNVNLDFARKKGDTVNIDPLYEPLYVNSRIKFVLAKKDPNGNCTNGIIHHYDENTIWKKNSSLYNYIYSTVGTNNWSPSKYLNVYVVAKILGDIQAGVATGGYTYKPGTAPNVGADAILLSTGLLFDPGSKGLTHEIGHWLGLEHVFDGNGGFRDKENTNSTPPYDIGFKCGNDDIADTPKTPGFLGICPPYLGLLDSCDVGKRPNIHNIMDYALCPIMFTQGQTDKMRFTLASSTASRDYLVSNKNLARAGYLTETYTVNVRPNLPNDTTFAYTVAPSTTCGPIADFYANKAKSCQGQAVVYNSTSYNNATGLSYAWTFEGGVPATSTLATPSVIYAIPGNYSTTLTVTNAAGTSTKVRNPFIATAWHSQDVSYPASEGFETASVGAMPAGWSITNKDYGTLTWETADYGSTSSKCMVLPNANYINKARAGDVDILETSIYNLSNVTNLTVAYDYSYARQTAVPVGTSSVFIKDETFTFEYSLDCGGNWSALTSTPHPTVMSTSGGTLTAPHVPFNQSKWVTKTYNGPALALITNKPDVKFRFVFANTSIANAQNLYIDNFNISGTVGLSELANNIGLNIYPNPTSSSSTLEFSSPVDSKAFVSVFDVTGRVVEESAFAAAAGNLTKYEVNRNGMLKAGVYFINLDLNGQKVTKKLIVQ
jgi:PKD repeat protein